MLVLVGLRGYSLSLRIVCVVVMIWFLEPGNYVIGTNPFVAVAEIGNYHADLPPEVYGIKGSVFTSNFGIELIVRNLYRAKEIKKLYVVGESDVNLFKPYEGLVKLHKNGVDAKGRIIGATGYRPYLRNVSKDEIEHFRSLDLVDYMGKKLLPEDISPRGMDNIRVNYIKKEVDEFDFPLNVNVRIEAENIFELWRKAVNLVYFWGRDTDSERGRVREILNLFSVLTNLEPGKNFFEYFSKSDMESYVRDSFLNPNEVRDAAYTYGNRLYQFGRLEKILNYLKRHKNTRRALVVLWDPSRDVENPVDVPCLTQVQFLVRGEKLYTFAYFRSHDVVKAYPENLYGLTQLVKKVLSEIKVEFGRLVVFSVSAHIYEEDFEYIKSTLYPREIKDPKYVPFKEDPAGNFIIMPDGESITVELRDHSNNTVFKLIGRDAMTLSSAISRLFPHLRPEHYLYLGRELQKAEFYNKGLLKEYVQG